MGASRETKYGGQEDVVHAGSWSHHRWVGDCWGQAIVAGVAVHGDLGWRKLEERREEMKMMFVKRLEV